MLGGNSQTDHSLLFLMKKSIRIHVPAKAAREEVPREQRRSTFLHVFVGSTTLSRDIREAQILACLERNETSDEQRSRRGDEAVEE